MTSAAVRSLAAGMALVAGLFMSSSSQASTAKTQTPPSTDASQLGAPDPELDANVVREEVSKIYESGRQDFEGGNYEQALIKFRRALVVSESITTPCMRLALLHNMATVHEQISLSSGRAEERALSIQLYRQIVEEARSLSAYDCPAYKTAQQKLKFDVTKTMISEALDGAQESSTPGSHPKPQQRSQNDGQLTATGFEQKTRSYTRKGIVNTSLGTLFVAGGATALIFGLVGSRKHTDFAQQVLLGFEDGTYRKDPQLLQEWLKYSVEDLPRFRAGYIAASTTGMTIGASLTILGIVQLSRARQQRNSRRFRLGVTPGRNPSIQLAGKF